MHRSTAGLASLLGITASAAAQDANERALAATLGELIDARARQRFWPVAMRCSRCRVRARP
jgi:hypothetical protein